MHHILHTIGDPRSIGAEITVKALQRLPELPPMRLTIIGDIAGLEATAGKLGVSLPQNDGIAYHPIDAEKPGAVAYLALDAAAQMMAGLSSPPLAGLMQKHQVENERGLVNKFPVFTSPPPSPPASGRGASGHPILVTGPISKRNLAEAGYAFGGHTEILEDLARRYFNAPDARAEMLFVYKNLRLLLLTRHIPLRDVAAALSQPGAVARPIKTLIAYLRHQAGVSEPRLAMLGINPHAGELEGSDEEKKFFMPVIHAVNAIGASRIDGPFPADGFFRGFDPATTPYDTIIAPYHDQGLIPFKMLAGYEAVNVTIGLPFLRTSVSHGTAEDIAGKSVAREDSLMAALRLAAESFSSGTIRRTEGH